MSASIPEIGEPGYNGYLQECSRWGGDAPKPKVMPMRRRVLIDIANRGMQVWNPFDLSKASNRYDFPEVERVTQAAQNALEEEKQP